MLRQSRIPCLMNKLFPSLLVGTVTAFVVFTACPALQAQTTTTTTTVIQPTPTPVPVITEQTTTTTVQTAVPVQPLPGQHTAEIEIVLSHGTVEAYFGRAARGEKLEIGGASLNIKLPSTATVTKIASRDKDSEGANRVTVDNPWHVVVPFTGGGRYVFNIVEWDHDPVVVAAVLKVDGNVIFSGHGRDDDFSDWPQKTYGEGARKTGSREVAFILPEAP